MNPLKTRLGQAALLIARFAVLASGLVCLLGYPWDTPLVAGRLGCLMVGVRLWVVGLALLASAAVWVPGVSMSSDTTCEQTDTEIGGGTDWDAHTSDDMLQTSVHSWAE